MLTRRQKELLDYLREYIAHNGIAPSFDEIRDDMGYTSKSGVFRHLNALEERGHIRRMRERARAIEIVAEPHLIPSLMLVSDYDLAKEAHRRGYTMGKWFEAKGGWRFYEIAPQARVA